MIASLHTPDGSFVRREVSWPVAHASHIPDHQFFYQFSERSTRYEGWHLWQQPGFLKLIERISLYGEPLKELLKTPTTMWQCGEHTALGITPHPTIPGLHITLHGACTAVITLDIRGQYDFSDDDRHYSVTTTGDEVSVSYQHHGIPHFLVLCTSEFHPHQHWAEVIYPRDAARNSYPDRRYVYELGMVGGTVVRVGYGTTLEEARAAACALSTEAVSLLPYTSSDSQSTTTDEIAHYYAEHSLRDLATQEGIWAGLPWFHQTWTRDALIAGLGLTPSEAIPLIEWACTVPTRTGELPTFAGLLGSGDADARTCADGLCWLSLLVEEHGLIVCANATSYEAFLQNTLPTLLARRNPYTGLLESGTDQTWMDTIGRSGYRIEIQLGLARACAHLATLTNDDYWERARYELLTAVRTNLFQNNQLLDGEGDSTIRPNVFVAYLLEPELLTQAQWERVFDDTLQHLETPWGGLSSISTRDARYRAVSTGETNESYHNGDSWFFINNLAGVALLRLQSERFAGTISGLFRSSTEELLFHHTLGHAGEISSASDLVSWGCGMQAFSVGTYCMFARERKSTTTERSTTFW